MGGALAARMVVVETSGRLERSDARANGDEERRGGGHGQRRELFPVEQRCQAPLQSPKGVDRANFDDFLEGRWVRLTLQFVI